MDKIFDFFNKAFNAVDIDKVFSSEFTSILYLFATIFAIIVFIVVLGGNKYAKGAKGLGVVVIITSALSLIASAAYCVFFALWLDAESVTFSIASFADIVPFVLKVWASLYGKIILGISAFMVINWILVFIYFLINSNKANKGANFFFIFFLIIATLVATPIPLYITFIPGLTLNTTIYALYYIGYLVIWMVVYIFLAASKKSLKKVFYVEKTYYYLPVEEKIFNK